MKISSAGGPPATDGRKIEFGTWKFDPDSGWTPVVMEEKPGDFPEIYSGMP